jgi:exportin-2 (importin alpha re-exporter)
LFAAPGALAQICERVIVPNMQLRDADVETFEDNPDEFMLKDLEVGATFCLRIFP